MGDLADELALQKKAAADEARRQEERESQGRDLMNEFVELMETNAVRTLAFYKVHKTYIPKTFFKQAKWIFTYELIGNGYVLFQDRDYQLTFQAYIPAVGFLSATAGVLEKEGFTTDNVVHQKYWLETVKPVGMVDEIASNPHDWIPLVDQVHGGGPAYASWSSSHGKSSLAELAAQYIGTGYGYIVDR